MLLLLIVVAFASEAFGWLLVHNYDRAAISELTLVGLTGLAYLLLSGRRR